MWSYVVVETLKNSSSVTCGLRDLTHVSPVSPSVRWELLCLPTRAVLKEGVYVRCWKQSTGDFSACHGNPSNPYPVQGTGSLRLVLPFKHKDRTSFPRIQLKPPSKQLTLATSPRSRNRRAPRLCWPVSLASLLSSRPYQTLSKNAVDSF